MPQQLPLMYLTELMLAALRPSSTIELHRIEMLKVKSLQLSSPLEANWPLVTIVGQSRAWALWPYCVPD